MSDKMKQESKVNHSYDRRSVLKLSGTALAAAVVPATASANKPVSAKMVDSSNPESTEEFVKRSLELGETKEVANAYQDLSKEQLGVLRDAINRLSSYDLEVDERTTSSDVTTMAIPISKTATLRKKIAGQTVHKTNHTLDMTISGGKVRSANNSSSGNAPVPLWHHKGLTGNYLDIQNNNSKAVSTRIHRYVHSVAGQVITTDAATIDISGYGGGGFNVRKNITHP
ncbi:hypothetical protein [Haladaptatus sp. DYF46]|uniref:hypothetical protein n=1 Tax=Haladaptatus sp. DYF46 TaxID=2886041 RepID=UPI001E3FADE9|nr:hypothetical protein [Haladaptatus sp. DYF46]